ncbi:TraM recognition domain-containing protein [Streptacidiphilus sp. N1-12]|uniref:TraM recognition domain-containing protein n=2 Tax=Streptacidiphilus alkalitolerans TaxID=3342712 RepID=A0ABV6V731_9ACTN
MRGGIPDGAIVGLLATLLGATALFWLSTALGALLTHGRLPHPMPFTGTPQAIRSLATAPNSIPAAWPNTPAAQLPSATAFWVTFFVLLALLITLALTILTAWMRLQAARRQHGAADQRKEPPPLWEPPAAAAAAVAPAAAVGPSAAASTAAASAAAVATAAVATAAVATAAPSVGPDAGPVPAAVPRPEPTPVPTPVPTREPAQVPPQATAQTAPPVPQSPPRPPGPFAFPAGTTALLVPDPLSAAAKRELLRRAVETATGPVLVVTDDLALWEARPPHRDARLFDPLRLVAEVPDAETRVRWAPHDRCDDPATATSRARALLAPTTRGGAAEAASQAERNVRDTAQTLLRCWLHAAALDGRPFRHVQRWASGSNRGEALTILRSADPHRAADGWDGELQALLTHSSDLRDSAIERILDALDVLSELQVQQACTPSSAADGLDLESLLRHRGTLYLLGRATETRVGRSGGAPTQRSAMPLLTALAEDVFERARKTAAKTSAGRLDPPLLCVLDNVAAVAPFPGLPELLARGGPLGLGGVAVLRSPEQARSRWGERAVHSLWTKADARAVLGPLGSTALEALLGALQTAAPEAEAAVAGGALSAGELLLLAARRPAQRYSPGGTPLGAPGGSATAASAPVPSGGQTAPQ